MKLIIGAGGRLKKGWTHHDVLDLPGIDICCEFWELPEHVKDEKITDIETTHFLEHIPMADTLRALTVIHNMLADKGNLYIEVPNFSWQAKMILEDPLDRQIVEYAYGGQIDKWDFHYNGFTPEQLSRDLVASGFSVVEIKPNSSIECTAQKLTF